MLCCTRKDTIEYQSLLLKRNVGGGKTISTLGGIALLVNSITGPGLVAIPLLFQEAGWLVPSITMIAVMVISSLAAAMLCEAMARVPGNTDFESRIEFTSLVKHYLPKWTYYCTLAGLIGSLFAMVISSIVISAQTMDLTFIEIFDITCAVELFPNAFTAVCVSDPGDSVSPFGNSVVISLGFIAVLFITIPMGYFNLNDNMIVQNGAFGLLLLICVEWFVNFFVVGVDFSKISVTGNSYSLVFGTIIFNYAFVTTIPSWKAGVSVSTSIWFSSIASTALYMLLGFFGAAAYHFNKNEDLLDVINDESHGVLHILSKICVYLFPAVACLTSIPVFSIIMRYNLEENGVCRKAMANFWAVLFPWILSVLFYTGSGLLEVINWTSLAINGILNFVIPMVIYIAARKKTAYWGDYTIIQYNFQALPSIPRINNNLVAGVMALMTSLSLIVVIGLMLNQLL